MVEEDRIRNGIYKINYYLALFSGVSVYVYANMFLCVCADLSYKYNRLCLIKCNLVHSYMEQPYSSRHWYSRLLTTQTSLHKSGNKVSKAN
jgi:hypothetical protein